MPRKAAVLDAKTEVVEETLLEDLPVVEDIVIVEVDEEACRQRAYEISQSEHAGTSDENWLRAEAELRGTPAE
jgi:hypothetical protein